MKDVFKIIKNVIKIISDVCFILLLVYFVHFIPEFFGYHPMVIEKTYTGVSFTSGSLVYYKKGKLLDYHKNDIILYENYDNHDMISVITNIDDGYLFISDDVKFKLKDIKGKVATVYVPFYGRYISFIQKHQFIFYLACGIVIVDFLMGFIINSFQSTYRKNSMVS